jgi:hypothetical protein
MLTNSFYDPNTIHNSQDMKSDSVPNKWVDNQWVACIFSHKEWNYFICRKMDGSGDHYVAWDKSSSERQMPHFLSSTESRPENNNNDDNNETWL